MLALFNGMIVTGIHDEPPNAGAAIIKLWEWRSGMPISTSNTAASPIGRKVCHKIRGPHDYRFDIPKSKITHVGRNMILDMIF
jgi:hypothetical protein